MMGISEADFWESTPRKIMALIDQKNRIEKARARSIAMYTAYFVWGKDPDKYENDNGLVAGRDVPINENALKGLLM